ncbi:MAG: type II secretion system protein GspG, partial [Thermoguttaceae bacterium]|nr:type II secretion system protein GspG [Thermoguttaceae bacterium]
MKRLAGTNSKESGFTLLELLIVLAILIVIIGILGTTVWGSYKKALVRAATVQVTTTLQNACEDFRLDFKRYPTQKEGLYILANMDNPEAQNVGANGMQNNNNNNNGNNNNNNGTNNNNNNNNNNNGMTGMQ